MAATILLVLVVVLVAVGLVFGVIMLLGGDDPGLSQVDPDGRARPLPNNRSLTESDLKSVRFDLTLRGYRMAQVDRVLRRTAYDVGYKDEMIAVLEAEVAALREGRREDADLLRKAREAAANPASQGQPPAATLIPDLVVSGPDSSDIDLSDRDASEPDVSEPDVSEPDVSEPNVSEPNVSDSDASESDVSHWDIGARDAEVSDAIGDAEEAPYEPALDTRPGRLAPRLLLDRVDLGAGGDAAAGRVGDDGRACEDAGAEHPADDGPASDVPGGDVPASDVPASDVPARERPHG